MAGQIGSSVGHIIIETIWEENWERDWGLIGDNMGQIITQASWEVYNVKIDWCQTGKSLWQTINATKLGRVLEK